MTIKNRSYVRSSVFQRKVPANIKTVLNLPFSFKATLSSEVGEISCRVIILHPARKD